jgi:hypothetical protein
MHPHTSEKLASVSLYYLSIVTVTYPMHGLEIRYVKTENPALNRTNHWGVLKD